MPNPNEVAYMQEVANWLELYRLFKTFASNANRGDALLRLVIASDGSGAVLDRARDSFGTDPLICTWLDLSGGVKALRAEIARQTGQAPE